MRVKKKRHVILKLFILVLFIGLAAFVSNQGTNSLLIGNDVQVGVSLSNDVNNDGIVDIGDEITIGNEEFYVFDISDTKYKLLSKYNLYIENEITYVDNDEELDKVYDDFSKKNFQYNIISEENDDYGKQSNESLGYRYETDNNGFANLYPIIGTLAYSNTNYWANGGVKSKYASKYPAYVYDKHSNLYDYINQYVDYLNQVGTSKDTTIGRLIKYEELVKLGCSDEYNEEYTLTCVNSNYSWLYSSSYWTGSAEDDKTIFRVEYNGTFSGISYTNENNSGLRPVIEISKKDLKIN